MNSENLYNRIIGTPTIEGIDRLIELTDLETLEFLLDILDQENSNLDIVENQIFEFVTNESLNESKINKKDNIVLDQKYQTIISSSEHIIETCSVCLANFEENENLTQIECNHFSHTECLNEWVKYKSECPVCRSTIKITQVRSCHFL
jgi:hypothetical protein